MVYLTLELTSNESSFEYSFPQEFLYKNYEIALIKLDGNLEVNNKINTNYANNKFYYLVNGIDQNNNPINEENVIDIPNGKYEFNELIMKINSLLKRDINFFKVGLEDGKVIIDIIKSTYSIDFSKQNTLANIFGFGSQILTSGKHITKNGFNSITINHIFVCCNLIDDSYINTKKVNSIYRFRLDDDKIGIEPRQIIYHKVTCRPNKIILRLVDINNNLIEVNNVNLFVELSLKELS
jgi:hypothetical protein